MAVTLRNAFFNHLPQRDFDPKYVPDSSEDVFTETVYLTEITLTNVTASSVTIQILDKQAIPLAIVDATLPAKQSYVIRFEGRYCPGGVSWVAGTASALVGYIRGRTNE
jgi:hypothetical protein